MPYDISLKRCADEIDRARTEVGDAMEAYSQGGSLRAVNEANKRLADAHLAYRDCSGLRIFRASVNVIERHRPSSSAQMIAVLEG